MLSAACTGLFTCKAQTPGSKRCGTAILPVLNAEADAAIAANTAARGSI